MPVILVALVTGDYEKYWENSAEKKTMEKGF